jgi:hypothetical protein
MTPRSPTRQQAASTYARRDTKAREIGFASYSECRRCRAEARFWFGDHLTRDRLDEAAMFIRDLDDTGCSEESVRDAFDEYGEPMPGNFFWLARIDWWRGGPDDPR